MGILKCWTRLSPGCSDVKTWMVGLVAGPTASANRMRGTHFAASHHSAWQTDESGKLSLPPRNRSRLVRWLCDRQCGTAGGLNGRPGKAPDVCYTWWTLASVELLRGRCGKASTETAADLVDELDMADFFDLSDLRGFIAKCMCSAGGVAAHPGDDPDPFHTFFGLAGLSLLDHADTSRTGAKPWLASISPVLAMPVSYVQHAAPRGYGRCADRGVDVRSSIARHSE
eukprot:CAMPEP_0177375680 /NCGR_PEP_ID=MMETSP0368-20130122/44824_1 /TAXON_ID=447022 ORGANISM="Scrippsiella hangoei-like, Strain SHHI-4" /NCGR_SAMPLE_ID=MMETSP0368 /ASSEMBLY_ACC=CAM_ASM_000363 /LENGTH=226 /DNA_ID=CAMNT_0018839367 /DNA_START=171 /DNA_END=848 /DNA_ORIENTATION=+